MCTGTEKKENRSDHSAGEWLRSGVKQLQEAGIREAENDAWLLFSHVTGWNRNRYFLHAGDPIEEKYAERYAALLKKRAMRIPLQHLTGEAWFFGRPFLVTPDVLIPRQDTEILVEEACRRIRGKDRILDLCTGSGCVLLSVLAETEAEGIGADISPAALAVAEKNRERLALSSRAVLVKSDLFSNISGRFALITANPPYIPSGEIPSLDEEVRDHDPYLALDGGTDGLDLLRKIAEEAKDYLEPGGWLLMEMGYDEGDRMKAVFRQCGYLDVKIVQDLAHLDRVILGRNPEPVQPEQRENRDSKNTDGEQE